jgi:catechol-2,3-dioxygenase
LVDLTDTSVETAKLTFPNGGKLELLQYHSHKASKSANHLNVNKIGHSHIALTVSDVHHAAHNIVVNGGTMMNSPRVSPNGLVLAVYCRDPEGNILELVEELL